MNFTRSILVGFFVCFAVTAHAATGDAIELTDWQTSGNPFTRSQSLDGLSITSWVDLNRQSGARANVTWSCVKDGTDFAVGITNSDLDISQKTGSFPLETKIDNGAISTVNITPETAKRFTLSHHLDPRTMFNNDIANIYKTTYLYVGFPVNGEDVVLRISLHESGVSRFMGMCLTSLQAHGDKKPLLADAKPQPEQKVAEVETKPDVKIAPELKPAPEPKPVAAEPKIVEPKPVKVAGPTPPNLNEVIKQLAADPVAPLPAQPDMKPGIADAQQPQPAAQPAQPGQPDMKEAEAEQAQSAPSTSLQATTPTADPASTGDPATASEIIKPAQVDLALLPDAESKPQVTHSESPAIRAKRKTERWMELAKYNLSAGEQITLRREYSPGAAPIRIGALYKKIPHDEGDRISFMTGEVTLGGGALANKNSLSIIDVHKDADGLDDWYYIKVNCPACTYDATTSAPNEGWVAAGDLTAWRDDPLCVSGTKGCN